MLKFLISIPTLLIKKLYIGITSPVFDWWYTITKDNGMYYFRYACHRFVNYCIYLTFWYIFLSHIDYFYNYRVYQIFYLGHPRFWQYPHLKNITWERFGPGWEYSGTLYDECALGDGAVVLEVFGDKFLAYVWYVFWIWNFYYIASFIFIKYGLYFGYFKWTFWWTFFIGLSIYIPKDIFQHYYYYFWTPGFTFFLLPWIILSAIGVFLDAIVDDDEDIDFWAEIEQAEDSGEELGAMFMTGTQVTNTELVQSFLQIWYALYRYMDPDWYRASPKERVWYLRWERMMVDARTKTLWENYSYREAEKEELEFKQFQEQVFIHFENLNYQSSRIRRSWGVIKLPALFFKKNKQKKLLEILEKDSKTLNLSGEAGLRHKYLRFKQFSASDINTFSAYIEDEEEDLIAEHIAFTEILYLFDNLVNAWDFKDDKEAVRYFFARENLKAYHQHTTNLNVFNFSHTSEILADLSIDKDYFYDCFLCGRYINENLFVSAQDINWLNARWWYYDILGNLWVAWEWILVILWDPEWRSPAWDKFIHMKNELVWTDKHINNYIYYMLHIPVNLEIKKKKEVFKLYSKQHFYKGAWSSINPMLVLKNLNLIDAYISNLHKLEKNGFFKPQSKFKLEELYFYKKGVSKRVQAQVDKYNATKTITSRKYLESNRVGFFLGVKNSIVKFVMDQFKIFVKDTQDTFLPLMNFIENIKTFLNLKNALIFYYKMIYTLKNLSQLELGYFIIWIIKSSLNMGKKIWPYFLKFLIFYKNVLLYFLKYIGYKPIKILLVNILFIPTIFSIKTLFYFMFFCLIGILKLLKAFFMIVFYRYFSFITLSILPTEIPFKDTLNTLFNRITNLNNYKIINIKKNILFIYNFVIVKIKIYVFKFVHVEKSFDHFFRELNISRKLNFYLIAKIIIEFLTKFYLFIIYIFKNIKLPFYVNKTLKNLNINTKKKSKLLRIRYKWFVPLYIRKRPSKSRYDFKSIYGANRIVRWLIFKFIVDKREWEKMQEIEQNERQKKKEKRAIKWARRKYWMKEFWKEFIEDRRKQ